MKENLGNLGHFWLWGQKIGKKRKNGSKIKKNQDKTRQVKKQKSHFFELHPSLKILPPRKGKLTYLKKEEIFRRGIGQIQARPKWAGKAGECDYGPSFWC